MTSPSGTYPTPPPPDGSQQPPFPGMQLPWTPPRPGVPPAPGYAAPVPPPASPTYGSTPYGFAPPPPPPPRRPALPLILAIALVLVVVAGATVFFLRRGDDSPDSTAQRTTPTQTPTPTPTPTPTRDTIPDTDDAVANLAELNERVGPAVAAGNRLTSINSACPLMDFDNILDLAPPAAADADDKRIFGALGRNTPSSPIRYECNSGIDQTLRMTGFTAFLPPDRPMKVFLSDLHPTSTLNEEREYRGGTVLSFCQENTSTTYDATTLCEANWSNGDLQVGVYSTEIDADEAEEWLEDSLEVFIDALAAFDATDVKVP